MLLVDSGADISVLPVSFLNSDSRGKVLVPRPGQRLRAANGSFIDTFGTKSLTIQLPGFSAQHSFRVAKVAQPIRFLQEAFNPHRRQEQLSQASLRRSSG